MKSLQRRIKRGHAKLIPTLLLNPDGTPKIKELRRSKRGKWL